MAFDKAATLRLSRWQSQLVKAWGEPLSWFSTDDTVNEQVVIAHYELGRLHVYLSYGMSEYQQSAIRHELVLVTSHHDEGWGHFISDSIATLSQLNEQIGAMLSFPDPAVIDAVSSAAVVTPFRQLTDRDLPSFKMLTLKLNYLSLLPLYHDELPLINKSGIDKFYQFLGQQATNAKRDSLAYMLG